MGCVLESDYAESVCVRSSASRMTVNTCQSTSHGHNISLCCYCNDCLTLFPAAVPSLPSKPVITPELSGHSVHLRCSFIPPPWSQPLGFQVVWARHIGHSMKAEIRQESTLKPFSVVEMDGVHFRLGETVIPARPCWKHMCRLWVGNVSQGSRWPLSGWVQLYKAKAEGKEKRVSYPIKGRQEKGGEVKSVAGWKSLAPHASHLKLFIQIFTVNSREISFTWTDVDALDKGSSCVVLHCFLNSAVLLLLNDTLAVYKTWSIFHVLEHHFVLRHKTQIWGTTRVAVVIYHMRWYEAFDESAFVIICCLRSACSVKTAAERGESSCGGRTGWECRVKSQEVSNNT